MAKHIMNASQVSAMTDLKAAAKQVGKSLRQKGHTVPHSVLLHALSAAFGHTDWHALKARLHLTESSSTANAARQQTSPERKPWLPTDSDTLFWVRLARLKGLAVYRKLGENSQWAYAQGEHEAPLCDSAKQAARRALNAQAKAEGDGIFVSAIFQSGGWVTPVDLDMDLLWVDGADAFAAQGLTASVQVSGASGQKATFEVECVALSADNHAWRITEAGMADFGRQLAALHPQPFVLEHERFETVEVTPWFAQRNLLAVQALAPGAVQGWRRVALFSDFWDACASAQSSQAGRHDPVWVIDRLGGGQQVAFKATAGQPLGAVQDSGTQVKGFFYTDDRVQDFEFDAAAWLQSASDQAITALLGCGLGGDYPADEIAYWMETRDAAFKEAFVYLGALQKARRECGFEVRVEAESFGRWVQENRPDLLATWLCEHFEVTLVAAEEPELRGMWDWLGLNTSGESVACAQSFHSQQDAARDASEVLGLWQRFLRT